MSVAIATAIDGDLKDILQAVTFAGILTANVGKIRELPKVGDVIDTLPCILIVPGSEKEEPLGTEGSDGLTYDRQIWIIDGSEGDFATDKPARELWLQQAINAVKKSGSDWRTTLLSCPTVWDIRIAEIKTLDRTKLNQDYAYMGFGVSVLSSE